MGRLQGICPIRRGRRRIMRRGEGRSTGAGAGTGRARRSQLRRAEADEAESEAEDGWQLVGSRAAATAGRRAERPAID